LEFDAKSRIIRDRQVTAKRSHTSNPVNGFDCSGRFAAHAGRCQRESLDDDPAGGCFARSRCDDRDDFRDTLTICNCWAIVGRQGIDMGKPNDLVQGTLDLLILKIVSLEPKHGWAIAKRIQHMSNEALQVQQGSLYPALYRLEQQGWMKADWRQTETGRQAKFYSLTRAGKRRLEQELANWDRLSSAINLVVRMT